MKTLNITKDNINSDISIEDKLTVRRIIFNKGIKLSEKVIGKLFEPGLDFSDNNLFENLKIVKINFETPISYIIMTVMTLIGNYEFKSKPFVIISPSYIFINGGLSFGVRNIIPDLIGFGFGTDKTSYSGLSNSSDNIHIYMPPGPSPFPELSAIDGMYLGIFTQAPGVYFNNKNFINYYVRHPLKQQRVRHINNNLKNPLLMFTIKEFMEDYYDPFRNVETDDLDSIDDVYKKNYHHPSITELLQIRYDMHKRIALSLI